MGMEEVVVVVLPTIFQLVLKLCVIGFAFTVQGSTAVFSGIPPIEGTPGPVQQRWPFISNAPSSEPQPNGSNLRPPLASPPQISAPVPQKIIGFVPSYSQSPLIAATPSSRAPPPLIFQDHAPSLPPSIPVISPTYNTAHEPPKPPNAHRRETSVRKKAVSMPNVPATAPSRQLPPNSTSIQPSVPEASSPSSHQNNRTFNEEPISKSIPPVTSPPRKSEENQPAVHPIAPATTPSISPFPDVSPIGAMPRNSSGIHPIGPGESPSTMPGPDVFHPSAPPPRIDQKKDGIPVAAPPDETHKSSPHLNHSPTKGSAAAPSTRAVTRHSNDSIPPFSSPKSTPNKVYHSSVPSPSIPFHTQNHKRGKITDPAPSSSYQAFPPSSKQQGPVIPPIPPTSRHQNYAPPPLSPVSASHYRSPKPVTIISPAPSPSPTTTSGWTKVPGLSPKVSPSSSSTWTPKMPLLPPLQALPPPPPNADCSAIVCTEPYANTPPGSPCGCVVPMQVGLSLSVALYTFFPLVSELAEEIAAGVFMKQSQVRIIGANSASQQPEKTIVLIDLVPLGETFDNTTAFLTYQRFWHGEVVINPALFGDYEVLYVRYLGLPPSPPLASSGSTIIDDGPYSGNSNNARRIKPLGVDVQKGKHKNGLGGGMIAIIAVSGSLALVLCASVAWVLLFRQRDHVSQPAAVVQPLPASVAKPLGTTASMVGSGLSSLSLSFGSSIPTYTGSAKTFSISDMERSTYNFDASRILGEGGFGRVYSGVLEDGTKVAVKVLKRDDQQGGREFLAEVEMLSRLHHRNLVKLIGICTEERSRCLVYELIPNGSVESHLHGVDKESAPLDWDARIKIALGAARGLAYLHEDSSPHVIHRDFKSSNILLEHDFTAKVSDFGLARTAFDEENRHISTRVMGTFGYVAPEYAMTGHLLVKSDVYSYGVVLLELLTGRKPVDMSQQPGQENLVAWARPLLTSKEGLEIIIDQSLGPDVPFDSVAKVAAIASMCVQPEVSHRPFMGEVVQALKLVCNECDESKEVDSKSASQDLSVDMNAGVSSGSGHLLDPFQNHALVPNYDSEPDIEMGLSMSDFFSTSVRFETDASGSLRRCSSSGPLRTGRGRELWRRMRLRGESTSEHRTIFELWSGSH